MGVRASAAKSRTDPDRTRHLSRRRAFDLGRSGRLPAKDGIRCMAARDPVVRLKNHLIVRGAWSEERHKQAEAEILDTVISAQKEAESFGTLHSQQKPSARDMFEGVFSEMPPHLRRQRQQAGV